MPLTGNVPSEYRTRFENNHKGPEELIFEPHLPVHLDSHHASAAVALLISTNEDPQNFNDFSSTLAKSWFQVSLYRYDLYRATVSKDDG